METKKATLNINGRSYPVLVESRWLLGSTQDVRLDRSRMLMEWGHTSPTLYNYYFSLDLAKAVGKARTTISENLEKVYTVNSDWLTYEAESSAEAVQEDYLAHLRLAGYATRKLEEFSEEGYLIVRVEDSMDMNEGTITIHYKKEEV